MADPADTGDSNEGLRSLLFPPGKVPGIGPERENGQTRRGAIVVTRYDDPYGSVRYLMTEGGLAIGALQIVVRDGRARIARVYVLPEFRRQRLAAALLAHARMQFSSVVHSDDLSPAGAAWKAAVGEAATFATEARGTAAAAESGYDAPMSATPIARIPVSVTVVAEADETLPAAYEANEGDCGCKNVAAAQAPSGRLTNAQVKTQLAPHGIVFTKKDGEFRVNFRGGDEATAYHTTDIDDALATGLAMAKQRAAGAEAAPIPAGLHEASEASAGPQWVPPAMAAGGLTPIMLETLLGVAGWTRVPPAGSSVVIDRDGYRPLAEQGYIVIRRGTPGTSSFADHYVLTDKGAEAIRQYRLHARAIGGSASEEAARFDNQPLETEAYAHRAGLPRGHAGIMWVANLPCRGGVDWGYTQDPKQALLISPYWQRRFKADMYRVGSDAMFVAPTNGGATEVAESLAEESPTKDDAYSTAMQRGLGTVGHNRHFTARELAEYLKISSNQARGRLNILTRSGYVGLDDDGYFVTHLGWTWIEGAARGAQGQEAAEIVGEATEYGVSWQQRRDGVWMARGTGGIYYMMPTPSGMYRVLWMADTGDQQDLGTHSFAGGAQVVARHTPDIGRLRQIAPERAAEADPSHPGLWANVWARRRAGLPPHKPGEPGYPRTLNVGEAEAPGDRAESAWGMKWERSGGGTGWRGTDSWGTTYLLRQAGGGQWNIHVRGRQYGPYASLDEAKRAVDHTISLDVNEAGEEAPATGKGWLNGRPSHAQIWANGKPLTIVRKGPRAWTLLVMNHPVVDLPDGSVTFHGRANFQHGLPEHVFKTQKDVEGAAFTIGHYMLGLGQFMDTYVHHATAGAPEAGEAAWGDDQYEVAYFDPKILRWRSTPISLPGVAPAAVHQEAARRLGLEPRAIVVTPRRQLAGGEAAELSAQADWDIHIYDPLTKTARTERLEVPGTRGDMGDSAAAAVAASKKFRVPTDRILALPHRERSLVNVSEVAAGENMPYVPEGQVCRPWVRMEKDPQAFNACMALAQKVGPLEGHDRLYEIVRQQMQREDQEVFYAIVLDTHLHLRAMSEISRGGRDRVPTPIPDLVRVATYQAVHYGGMGLGVAHCHPSGKPRPSDADKQVTEAVEAACNALGIMFVDHLVIGAVGYGYYSFRKKKIFNPRT